MSIGFGEDVTAAASPPTSALPRVARVIPMCMPPLRVSTLGRTKRGTCRVGSKGHRGPRGRNVGTVRRAPDSAFHLAEAWRFVESRGPFCYFRGLAAPSVMLKLLAGEQRPQDVKSR